MTEYSIPVWIPEGKDRVYIKSPFALKDAVKSVPGSSWDKPSKCWTIPASPAACADLFQRLDGQPMRCDRAVMALLEQAVAETEAAVHKTAGDSALAEIPGLLPAWLHQKRAYHFAFSRRGTMLAMDMGTGKSRTTVSLLDGWELDFAVIVCPAKVCGVWPKQFAIHSSRDWNVIAPPTSAPVARRVGLIRKAMVTGGKRPTAIVVNYESSWRPVMKELLLDVIGKGALVIDESHRIKSPSGVSSKFVGKNLAPKAKRVLALTGTPMPHSPMDVFAQYRAVDPGIFGSTFSAFRSRYAVMGGFEGKQIIGYQREAEFAARFGSASFVVKKEEAGLDLPDVVHTERRVRLEARSMTAYRTVEEDFVLGVGDGTVTTQNALTKLLRLQQITSGYVKDDDGEEHQIGDEKIKELGDLLEDLPVQEPVVIFARFKHDIAAIRALCESTGRRVGEVSGSVKEGSADYGLTTDSTMREDIDVIVLQLQSGGVGIDLTRAAYAIYYSLDFSLGNYEQSLARLDRPGQKRSVTYVHLIADDTKDDVVYEALQSRKDVVEAVITASRQESMDLAA